MASPVRIADGINRRFIGIDPGLSGAIAYIDTVGWRTKSLDAFEVPTIIYNKRRVIDHMALCVLMDDLCGEPDFPVWAAAVEMVNAMPKQGVTSSFRFGMAFGALTQAISDKGVTTTVVPPTKWKRQFDLIGVDKGAVREASRDYFNNPDLWPMVKDHNKAEAAFLAAYARNAVDPFGRINDGQTEE